MSDLSGMCKERGGWRTWADHCGPPRLVATRVQPLGVEDGVVVVLRKEGEARALGPARRGRPGGRRAQLALLRARLRRGEGEALQEDHVVDHEQHLLRRRESRDLTKRLGAFSRDTNHA